MKTVTLDYIVKNVMAARYQSDMKRYPNLLQFAIRGARDLNLFNTTTTKSVQLPMLPNKAVNLPSDYVKYEIIGLCINDRIITLGLDEGMCLVGNIDACGDPIQLALNNVDDDSYWNYTYPLNGTYRNGQYKEGLYGLGGGFNGYGYYKVNKEAGQIQFSSEVPTTEIYLQYISDGINPDGSSSVPVEAVECLIAWTQWKAIEAMKNADKGDREYWRQQYITEFRKLKHFNLMFTAQEYLDSRAKGIYQAAKR